MKKIGLLVFIMGLTITIHAQETLPPYHWSWKYLNYLKTAGYLPELDFTSRPLYRNQIAQALLQINTDKTSSETRGMIQILRKEFAPEIRFAGSDRSGLGEKIEKFIGLERQGDIKAGAFGAFSWSNDNTGFEKRFDYSIHPNFALRLGNHFFLYNNTRIFKQEDPYFHYKKLRGFYSYVEQGYFLYQNGLIRFKMGRDFLQEGPGRTGQLLFSENSRPFDLYQVRLGGRHINFSFYGIQLNRRANKDSSLAGYAPFANRFINGHRISVNIKDRYWLGLSEVVLYGGPDTNWELGYMNPLGLYYAYNANGPFTNANSFYDLDWDLYLPRRVNVYGEFLVDDFQIDKKAPGDLEPNELGVLAGINWNQPFRWQGSLFNLEYVQVRNRTYNAPVNDWEKFLHRNRVIGYYLGNDFDLLHLEMEKWWRADIQTVVLFQMIRKGEGTVRGAFNKDYMNYTVEQGYSEPFPTGTVEKHRQVGLGVFYRPSAYGNISAQIAYNTFRNYEHVDGRKKSEVSFTISLWLQWDKWWHVEL